MVKNRMIKTNHKINNQFLGVFNSNLNHKILKNKTQKK